MIVNGKHYHTIWIDTEDISSVKVIDQGKLPFEFEIAELRSCEDAFTAIRDMVVRGAPLIGVTGAYGIYLSLLQSRGADWKKQLGDNSKYLKSARPTAVNLANLIDEMVDNLLKDVQLRKKLLVYRWRKQPGLKCVRSTGLKP